jgi:hypothetical protein
MTGKRTFLFLTLYAAVVLAMLFVFLFVQSRYGADTSGPYKRRFLDKFFLQVPAQTFMIGDTGENRTTPLIFHGFPVVHSVVSESFQASYIYFYSHVAFPSQSTGVR